MDISKDYYKILGVDRNASADDIKKAFRTKAKQYHPDMFPNDMSVKAKFIDINEANQVLSNPTTRAEYDREFFSNSYTGYDAPGSQGASGFSNAPGSQGTSGFSNASSAPETKESILAKADALLNNRKFEDAFQMYNRGVMAYPDSPECYFGRLMSYTGIVYCLSSKACEFTMLYIPSIRDNPDYNNVLSHAGKNKDIYKMILDWVYRESVAHNSRKVTYSISYLQPVTAGAQPNRQQQAQQPQQPQYQQQAAGSAPKKKSLISKLTTGEKVLFFGSIIAIAGLGAMATENESNPQDQMIMDIIAIIVIIFAAIYFVKINQKYKDK